MTMRGTAALAMWWDMSAHMQQEFENWHTHEHFPERLGVPGFLRSTRWTDADGGERVFVLYELQDFSVLSSEPYVARLNAPTPWSTKLMPHHRNMVRAQTHVIASCGGVAARYAATLRFSAESDHVEAITRLLLPRMKTLSHEAGILGAHLLKHQTPKVEETAEQKIRVAPDRPGDWVLILCGYSGKALKKVAGDLKGKVLTSAPGVVFDGEWQTYSLSCSAIPLDFECHDE